MSFPIGYNVVDYIGIVLGIISTVVGSIIGYFRYKKNQKDAGYTEAEELYLEYLNNAIEHPLCASPSQEGVVFTPEMQARHTWFVSVMLYACDKILNASDDHVWKEVVVAQMMMHKDYLTSEEFILSEEIKWYGDELESLYYETFKDIK